MSRIPTGVKILINNQLYRTGNMLIVKKDDGRFVVARKTDDLAGRMTMERVEISRKNFDSLKEIVAAYENGEINMDKLKYVPALKEAAEVKETKVKEVKEPKAKAAKEKLQEIEAVEIELANVGRVPKSVTQLSENLYKVNGLYMVATATGLALAVKADDRAGRMTVKRLKFLGIEVDSLKTAAQLAEGGLIDGLTTVTSKMPKWRQLAEVADNAPKATKAEKPAKAKTEKAEKFQKEHTEDLGILALEAHDGTFNLMKEIKGSLLSLNAGCFSEDAVEILSQNDKKTNNNIFLTVCGVLTGIENKLEMLSFSHQQLVGQLIESEQQADEKKINLITSQLEKALSEKDKEDTDKVEQKMEDEDVPFAKNEEEVYH